MVSSWRVLLVVGLAGATFAGVNAQPSCTISNHDALCEDFSWRLDDGCPGAIFFGNGQECCDCNTGLPGFCGIGRCDADNAYDLTMQLCIEAGGDPDRIGSGWCTPENNIPECLYDRGDCCECDCTDNPDECGSNGFNCLDPRSSCYGAASDPPEAEPSAPVTPIDIECTDSTAITAAAGVVDQIAVEAGWRLVSGEIARHGSDWRVRTDVSSEGAFVAAEFVGTYDVGAVVRGSPTTVVEFRVAVEDAAGNQDGCSFFLGILPEADSVPAPAPAPVVPWWGVTPAPAPGPVVPAWYDVIPPAGPPSDEEVVRDPTPSPVTPPAVPEAPLPAPTPSPMAPPVAVTPPVMPDAPAPTPTTPSPVAPPVAPAPAPTPSDDGGQDSDDTAYVEVGTKTTVDVSASAYDGRPGERGDDVGCGEDGCLPALAHDGIGEEDVESRWSCAEDIDPEGQCEIEFAFGSPQDIRDVEVALRKGDERTRTLKVKINGDKIGEFESQSGSIVTSLGIEEDDVHTVTLESIGIGSDEWISILEVRFMVDP